MKKKIMAAALTSTLAFGLAIPILPGHPSKPKVERPVLIIKKDGPKKLPGIPRPVDPIKRYK